MILFIFSVKMNAQTKSDEKLVRNCFMTFKKSFSEKNADESYKLIDRKSTVYLDSILTKIKYADSLTVCSLDPIDKLILFCTRSLVEKSRLKIMNSKGLFDFLIKNNLMGTYKYIEIGDITIDGNHAKAKIPQSEPNCFLIFNKENSKWKYHINSVFDIERTKFKTTLLSDDFIIQRVETMTNKSFNKYLWIAPL